MIAPRFRVLLWVVPLVIAQWMFISFAKEKSSSSTLEAVFLTLFWGTLFGHTALAAAWTAFGPGPLTIRLPLALIWLAALAAAAAINLSRSGGPVGLAIPIGVALFGQWLLLQIPLWGLAIGLGLQLRHKDELEGSTSRQQFTIRQLIIITAIVGVIFGVGRIVLPATLGSDLERGFQTIFVAFAVAQAVLSLPLLLAALLRKYAVGGVVLALVLNAVSVLWEMPLLNAVTSGSTPMLALICINAGTTLVILLMLLAVRLNGYSLCTSGRVAKA